MIKEAVENLNGKATYGQIKSYIKDKYGEVNENSLNAQITVLYRQFSFSHSLSRKQETAHCQLHVRFPVQAETW